MNKPLIFHFFLMASVSILLDRDSVCMGDDCNSHQKEITIDGNIFLSDFLKMVSKYVPSMKNVVWAVVSSLDVIGYIITDEQRIASVEVCGDDQSIVNCNISKVFCRYFHSGSFSWRDGKTGEIVKKYPECKTLLEKVKMQFHK